ncbi:hypothetical protein OKW21_004627 [Catalinimonas alkaloidigena]|uniref:hypothetical protein n=1 Tax=Catalinimonas alkaloidigena TaxID=1075417 RepID=UPI002406F724|nr:hypothetical protein [Catalinimonas alkaloidigena]MDF9799364.1 hypothetical protein [Catalinimonas alkaloidigena]
MRHSVKYLNPTIVLVILSYVFSVNGVYAQTGETVQLRGAVSSSEDGEALPGVNLVGECSLDLVFAW